MQKEQEILIVKVETNGEIIDVGAEAAKAMPGYCRYQQPIKYTLADGRVVETTINGKTKPVLKAKFESRCESVAIRAVSAQMLGDEYMGFVTKMKIR